MSLKPLFSNKQTSEWFNHFQDRAEEKMYTLLQAAGERFVKYARESGDYKDQTGNLRSSVGYIILSDGNILTDNFEKSKEGSDRDKGKRQGYHIANEIALSYNKGFVLIGLAGMNYALCVEAKGKDVISFANRETEEWLRKAINTVFDKM